MAKRETSGSEQTRAAKRSARMQDRRVKLLVGIISRGDAKAYTDAVSETAVALNFSGIGFGTAKSNYMSYLGLDEIEKRIVFSMIPDYCEKQILKSVNRAVRMYLPGKGLAFTMPMSSVSSILGNAILSTPVKEDQNKLREDIDMSEAMKDTEIEKAEREENADRTVDHDLIVAVVNQKFTDKVLDSARAAGAAGATIMHTRSLGNERAEQMIGTSFKQETDTVLLLSSSEYKLKIMEAIRDTAGLKTDGGAVIFSLPVDSITGIGRFAEE